MAGQEQLMELSRAYARAVDRGDVDGFVSLFTEDATLRLTAHGDPASVTHIIRGHEELAAVPRRMERYHRSFHLLGQATYGDDGHGPTGEVYCLAHHLTVREGATEADEPTAEDLVLYVRYADRYRRSSGDLWLIADRLVQVDWTETRPAHLPADAAFPTDASVPSGVAESATPLGTERRPGADQGGRP